ncbi:MAG: hypothetical protein NTX95_06515 [Actinobacteria bacterium]|nr:hypothetical protein [Actinomycetota bacterium]
MPAFLSFFDDDYELDEAPPSRGARKRPSMPSAPKGKGPQRLLVLVIGILILLVAGYFLVQRCQRDREVSSYQSYVSKSNEVAKASGTVGSEFSAAILTAGQTPDGLDKSLTREIQSQQQIAKNAADLSAPDGVSSYKPFLVQSMQYRVSGLQGLQKALRDAFNSAGTTGQVPLEQSAAVAATFQRLIASDVVYSDSYQEPVKQVLAQKSINATVEDSQFVDPKLIEFAAPQRMQSILNALLGGVPVDGGGTVVTSTDAEGNVITSTEGAVTGDTGSGALHGTTLISSLFNPGGTQLDPASVNEVDSANDMSLAITVQNSGDATEVSVKVNVVLRAKGMDDRTLPTGEITTLDPGAQGTVEIPFGLSDIVFDSVVTAKVTVEKVPGEQNIDNNIGVYQIQFRLKPA